MKHKENIQKDALRKGWRSYRLAPVALAISAAFILAGCEQTDETVSMYQNADDCSAANPSMSAQCTTAYNNALKEAEKTAPKYASKEDCVAEFGEAQCTPVPDQAGTAAQPTQTSSSWMPLMAAYMMGRMMSGGAGFAQQPLFSSRSPASPANGQFVNASGKSYGAATSGRTVTVPKTALASKPATTNTITRGGFGEDVAKQTSMQRSSASTSSSSRSMGG
ncbi:DUF1190 family protein [Symbiopectobacterium sp. RP]|uniref:DUF1190 family protein n=1 Tax=Symbiopectobacterium sp. RP TaxID=3248553 RepID=UPI003D2DD9DB